MGLFSEELQEMDRNTVRYMVDEMQETIEKQKGLLDEKQSTIEKQQNAIENLQAEIEELKKRLNV